MELLLYENAYARVRDRLKEIAPAVEPVTMRADGSLSRAGQTIPPEATRPEIAWASADLLVGGPTRDFMIFCLKSDSIRWLQSGAAGFDHPIFAQLAGKGIRLTNSNAAAVAISEFVLASVLEVYQTTDKRRDDQAQKMWVRRPFREIAGTTWLIVGIGNIGGEVAKRARAFGAHVVGVRRNPDGTEPADETTTPDRLPGILPRADVAVLAAPANDGTERLVDRSFLLAMKPDSVLVNIARGALIDEAALLESLGKGRPGHAILDVFETEPLAETSPLWVHPQVHVTPHAAAMSDGTRNRGDLVFLENLKRYLDNGTLQFEVALTSA